MKNQDMATNLLFYLQNSVLMTLKNALSEVPNEKLDYIPTKGLNSIKYLFYHAISIPYLYLLGIGKSEINSEHFNSIALNIDKVKDKKELLIYYDNFNSFLDQLLKEINHLDLNNKIFFNLESIGFGISILTNEQALETAFEEMVHHRGQIYIYLKELGIKHPPLYRHLHM